MAAGVGGEKFIVLSEARVARRGGVEGRSISIGRWVLYDFGQPNLPTITQMDAELPGVEDSKEKNCNLYEQPRWMTPAKISYGPAGIT